MNAFNLLVLLVIKNVLTVSSWGNKPTIPNYNILIPCKTFKANVTKCPLGFTGDPLMKECFPKCTEKCVKGKCKFQFCYGDFHDIDNKDLAESCDHILTFAQCWQADLKTKCRDPRHRCVSGFVVHPYDYSECILSCTDKSCRNGICSSDGNCVCNLGYRLDPRNGRNCVKVPQFFYENPNTTCVKENEKKEEDPPTEPTTKTTIDSRIHFEEVTNGNPLLSTEETTVPSSTASYSDERTSNSGSYETRTAVLACTTAIFLLTTIVLAVMLIRIKRAATEIGEVCLVESQPNSKFRSKPRNEVIMENDELYGDTC